MKKINVFYADDDEDDLMLFNEVVEKISNDYENQINLHIHLNGESLIENIKRYKDSDGVVFLDINMPLQSGFEILEKIRKEPEISQFPVIMYSTSSNKDSIVQSQNLGANFYVVKPYEFSTLLKMISTFIQMNWKNYHDEKNNFLYKG